MLYSSIHIFERVKGHYLVQHVAGICLMRHTARIKQKWLVFYTVTFRVYKIFNLAPIIPGGVLGRKYSVVRGTGTPREIKEVVSCWGRSIEWKGQLQGAYQQDHRLHHRYGYRLLGFKDSAHIWLSIITGTGTSSVNWMTCPEPPFDRQSNGQSRKVETSAPLQCGSW